MGRKLTHAPVYFVLVQVRFNSLPMLDSRAPEVHEKFRILGYPDQQRQEITTFALNPQALNPQVTPTKQVQFTACNIERTSGFVFDATSMSFQTTEYTVYEDFSKAFSEGLEIIHGIMGLAYYERIGLRYLDAIVPTGNEKLNQYVDSSMLGLSEKLSGQLQHSFSETVSISEIGRVVFRAITQSGPVGFPADLQPSQLTLASRFLEKNCLHTVLDTDAFNETRRAFNVGEITSLAEKLKTKISEAFKLATTEHARKMWE